MSKELVPVSLSVEAVGKWKTAIWGKWSFVDRISLALTLRCAGSEGLFAERDQILGEIMFLEGQGKSCGTKDAEKFKRGQLNCFWKKHFCASRHFLKNIGIRWNLEGNGNADLDKAIQEAQSNAQLIDEFAGKLAYRIGTTGWEERVAARRLTGDWIIFANCDGLNYYLDVATHAEGKVSDRLLQKLVQGCRWEFPDCFAAVGIS